MSGPQQDIAREQLQPLKIFGLSLWPQLFFCFSPLSKA